MKLLREPLVHFLLVGAGLFLALGLTGRLTEEASPGRIVITQAQIQQLAAGFDRAHRRPPSPDEMEALIRDSIREEVYYREALALGLDRDDAVIRQRLRQKMEFVSDDVAALTEPTDAQLRAYLREHPDAFRTTPRVSFTHVYLDPARRGDTLARDAADLRMRLADADGAVDVSALGDPLLLAERFDETPANEIAALFGETFAAELSRVAPGEWAGPIRSAYGVHVVFISRRWQAEMPAFEEVRDAVRSEWARAQREQAKERLFASLLNRYAVTVEESAGAGDSRAFAAEPSR